MEFPEFLEIFMAEKLPMVNRPLLVQGQNTRVLDLMQEEAPFKYNLPFLIQDPYLASVEEGLALASQEKLLFLWYEEVRSDIMEGIRRIAHYLDEAMEEEEISQLAEYVDTWGTLSYLHFLVMWESQIKQFFDALAMLFS